VKPAVAEAWDHVQEAEVKHTDGTSWLQSGVALSLWTLASSTATVFKIVANSSRATLRKLYGALEGILVVRGRAM
jgi:transposase